MKLRIGHRILLLYILPDQGDLVTMRVVREAARSLEISPTEMKRYAVAQKDGMWTWNDAKARPVEIKLSEAAVGVISDRLRELSEKKQLRLQHLELYEMFVEGKKLQASKSEVPEEPCSEIE